MSIKLGDTAPNFQAESSVGDINFYNYLGDSWGFCFRILQITHRYAQQSWDIPQNFSLSLMPEVRK